MKTRAVKKILSLRPRSHPHVTKSSDSNDLSKAEVAFTESPASDSLNLKSLRPYLKNKIIQFAKGSHIVAIPVLIFVGNHYAQYYINNEHRQEKNTQSANDSLKELNSRLLVEITALRKENTEVNIENSEIKVENVKLKQALEEHESRFAKLEQKDKEKTLLLN
ncbi:hypothetical protein Glove_465g49 [Diversispora epigaea]|uniref:Uncharacterized protein n=1 Tax=Diversispora epigaea TaxID=1348612 RepID=A0A397GVK1_9GLOM|nr:hypothetical protein Glove_465g49 [Diversispora epigaea]